MAKVSGTRGILKALDKSMKRASQAASSGAYELGVVIMRESNERVPVDTTALRQSGYVSQPHTVFDKRIVEIGYGGPAEAYAVVQHEHTEFNHPRGGEAKYLENAINATTSMAKNVVLKAASNSFQSGKKFERSELPLTPGHSVTRHDT